MMGFLSTMEKMTGYPGPNKRKQNYEEKTE